VSITLGNYFIEEAQSELEEGIADEKKPVSDGLLDRSIDLLSS